MSSIDILSMCLRNLFKRKLRTILTVLGVTVGTASIVVMISLGLAINLKFEQQIENMGDVTLITINSMSYWSDSGSVIVTRADGLSTAGPGGPPVLTDEAIAEIEKIPNVLIATPVERMNLYFKSGSYVMDNWNAIGIKMEAIDTLGVKIAEGRMPEPGEQNTVIFGAFAEAMFREPNDWNWWDRLNQMQMGEELEPRVDLLNDKITMSVEYSYISSGQGMDDYDYDYDFIDDDYGSPSFRPQDIYVAGIAEYKNDYQLDIGIIFDIETLKKLREDADRLQNNNNQSAGPEGGWVSARRGGRQQGYEMAYAKVTDMAHTKEVNEKIQEMGFYAWYPTEWLDTMQEQARTNQNFLAAIGAVSLLVAAIGIANTMIMAIYERTREIGVMKVIGAAIRDIKWLFLLESALIGLVGGIVGVGVSFLASYLLNNARVAFFAQMFQYIGDPDSAVSVITPWLAGLALLFAAGVGLVSGYFPARRAMRLSALSAIRTE